MNKIQKVYKRPVQWHKIRLLVLDCDGVLTDGRIIYAGDQLELKHFDAHDGMGFIILRHTDVEVAVITGRSSEALTKRCSDLKIRHLYQGVAHKLHKLEELLSELGLSWEAVAYMGDDWNDIPVMRKAAISAAPADAMEEIRELADFVTTASGGRGAVREFINYILTKQGRYEKAVEAYLQEIS